MLEKDDKIGDYTLVRFLGRGQFGEVWLAEKKVKFSTKTFRHALKFLSNLGDEINLKAAEAEIDTWIEASGHPNIMSVLDMLVHKDHIIIASEFAEGGSLKDWLKKTGGKAPSEEKALEMMLGILRGIEHLHSRSVVHRDLKPDNILLQNNFPRITDFGISRIVAEGTLSTKPIGSPAYMSPESFMGSKSPQIDIWSAGVILYEMLTGKFPFEHEMIFGLVNSIQNDAPKSLPGFVPSQLRTIVETALQKDVGQRYQTAEDMRQAVESAIYGLKSKSSNSYDSIETLPLAANFSGSLAETELPVTIAKKGVEIPEKTQPSATQPAETQAVAPEETDEKIVEKTKDWREVEKEERLNAVAEQAKIAQIAEDYQVNKGLDKKKRDLLLGIGGGALTLLVAGLLIWSLSGAPSTVSNNTNNTSTAENSPAKAPTSPPEMAYVAGGEFSMGRDDGKSDAEKPVHKVSVKPFFMDIYEVTNDKYAEFVKSANYRQPAGWKNGSYLSGQAKFPVVGVNWDDANAYAKWAGKRLPTEEEWEFAARGTGNFIYPWGNDWKQENANVGNQGFAEAGKFGGKSPFGLYDMSGNAWEWTSSDFKAYPGGKLPDVFAGKANLKTIRGGSFEATKDFATSTYRIGWAPTGAENYDRTGFRCVKDAPQGNK